MLRSRTPLLPQSQRSRRSLKRQPTWELLRALPLLLSRFLRNSRELKRREGSQSWTWTTQSRPRKSAELLPLREECPRRESRLTSWRRNSKPIWTRLLRRDWQWESREIRNLETTIQESRRLKLDRLSGDKHLARLSRRKSRRDLMMQASRENSNLSARRPSLWSLLRRSNSTQMGTALQPLVSTFFNEEWMKSLIDYTTERPMKKEWDGMGQCFWGILNCEISYNSDWLHFLTQYHENI